MTSVSLPLDGFGIACGEVGSMHERACAYACVVRPKHSHVHVTRWKTWTLCNGKALPTSGERSKAFYRAIRVAAHLSSSILNRSKHAATGSLLLCTAALTRSHGPMVTFCLQQQVTCYPMDLFRVDATCKEECESWHAHVHAHAVPGVPHCQKSMKLICKVAAHSRPHLRWHLQTVVGTS